MHGAINCKYNNKGTWCTNKQIKKSLYGLGSRLCIEYPYDHGETCNIKEPHKKPTHPPPPERITKPAIRYHHDFVIVSEKCYFCGKDETIVFHEHYTFCSNCSAIYTTTIIQSSGCKHIKGGVPRAIHEPWYKNARERKAYIKERVVKHHHGEEIEQYCSICGSICTTDGW
jgi:hypothetical protein